MSETTYGLQGKLCVVTGATSGIGRTAAVALARMGGRVIGVGRDEGRSAAALQELAATAAEAGAPAPAFELADLSSLRQTEELAARLSSSSSRLDVLVNCAGTFTARRVLTSEGFETQFAVNHLAPFLLTTSLLPLLLASPDGRVITVSSASHRLGRIHWKDPSLPWGYLGLRAYGQSKLANVLFTRELARRLGPGSSVTAYAVDPGLVNTDMGLKHGLSPSSLFWRLRRRGGTSPEVTAAFIALLAAAPETRRRSGLYWKDGREFLPSRRALDDGDARRLWDLSESMLKETLGRSGLG